MDENSVDSRIKLYKAISGLIPGGSFFSEYLIDRIPGQRMERLFKFVEELNERISKLENRDFVNNENYSLLAESTIIEATKPISKERMEWLGSILIPTTTLSDQEIEFRRKALAILTDLSDLDVECLLKHISWKNKIRYEQSLRKKHLLTVAEFNKLSSHELFTKYLENERLDIHRKSLSEKSLIENRGQHDDPEYQLTELGKLFIYILTNEYPRG